MTIISFEERMKLDAEYQAWRKAQAEQLDVVKIADCPANVILFLQTVKGWGPKEKQNEKSDHDILIWKDVEYNCKRKCMVVGHGFYKDREWVILNLTSHPTAYVKLTDVESKKLGSHDYFYDIDVHGGCTWLDTFVPVENSEAFQNVDDGCKWFGWDYAHLGDYHSIMARSYESIGLDYYGKKYSTEDIYKDVKSVVDQLNEFDWSKTEVENGGD